MKINLYSLADSKMGVFLAPFCARNDVDAGRQIAAALRDPQMAHTPMVSNPRDFTLNRVGSFDDEDASLRPDTAVVCTLDMLAAQLPS